MKLWSFGGGPGTLPYRLFDALRRDLNVRLAERLFARALGSGRLCLEAGSGPAFASSLLRGAGAFSVAVDIDREALAEAHRRDPGLPLVRGDLLRLPFREGSFDLTWNSSTMEHLPSMDPALAQMARVTRAGGCVFVGVPYRGGPLAFQPAIRRSAIGLWLGDVFGKGELARRLANHGLAPQDSWTYFFRFFVGVLARKPRSGSG